MFQMTDERTDKPYRESYQNLPGATPATEVPILRVAGDIVGKISEGLTTAVIKTLSGT